MLCKGNGQYFPMCCFTGKVESVADTSIFARMGSQGKQFVVYSMTLTTREDVAMVLPIPVKAGTGEKAVQFFDFSAYPQFFEDLERVFFPPSNGSKAPVAVVPTYRAPLEVVSVGAFDASYVPTIADFDRLDPRFRLSADAWKRMPAYEEFGFAVFKLKSGHTRVHPMAFSFPSADPRELFFPTVHIHDGRVHRTARFDHTLYGQGIREADGKVWTESPGLAGQHVKTKLTHAMVRPEQHVYRCRMQGRYQNGDVFVKSAWPA